MSLLLASSELNPAASWQGWASSPFFWLCSCYLVLFLRLYLSSSLGEVKFPLSRFPLQLIWPSQFSSLQESTRNTWPQNSPQGTPHRICSLITAWVEGIWIQRPRTAVLWRSCLLWVWGLTNLSLKESDSKNFSLSDPDKEFIKGVFVLWLANKVLHIYIYILCVYVCIHTHRSRYTDTQI